MSRPFWERKSLDEMTSAEWESLCDGCGRCCLIKLEDEADDQVYFTNVACRLLDCDSCRCREYTHRFDKVADCLQLTPETLPAIHWLPSTCAYRLIHQGRKLYSWHPLLSGDVNSVHRAGISVQGRVVSEIEVREDDLEDHIIHWVQ